MRAIFMAISLTLSISVCAQQKHADGIDDFLQYAPYASVFIIKACGVESRDNWPKLTATVAASWVLSGGIGYTLKHSIKEWRPDHSDQKSFPSGHTMFAFAGATALHKEFGSISPWISVAGYGAATFVAIDRIAKDRHHWYDVAAGAGIGFAATELSFYLSDKLIKNDRIALAFTGQQLDIAWRW